MAGRGQPGPVTGFSLPSTGAHQFTNSKTYQPDASADNSVDAIEELVLQAADRERPYVKLVPERGRMDIRSQKQCLGR